MVTNIAFHPSKIEPSYLDATTGPIRDGAFTMADDKKISFRFYVPKETDVKIVVYFFHGNAEVCTAMDDIAEMLHSLGAALLSIDYRGYSWGTGQPSLKKLCSDADQCFRASETLLADAGFAKAKRVMFGRSIGATCAVHLAAKQSRKVHGLIVDSGLMSIKQLPTVQMLGPMVFQSQPEMFQKLAEPFDTLGKLPAVGCPALVMHGDKDEIVPYSQAVQCHSGLKTPKKKLQCWVGASHNDVWAIYAEPWRQEVKLLLEQALDFQNEFPSGVLVEAHSLSATEMNGLQGRVLGPQEERLRVDFPQPAGALKPSNLKIIEVEPEKGVEDFPIGAMVEAFGLSKIELNGLRGKVLGPREDRVEVKFDDGPKALKPSNLKLIE
ncbi:Alpha/beta hydrolase domain-containing protein aho-3 (Abnormal hunger orientation protein 3) [Durusdinium trenchii]|uniref:Alpha/beta hydrolase domain-containing protein aho-3 (Abnormal hunger orientation protein 3) n=1 Tax=Durusdinium trenchii TaxID=1381693 RepID=A0ABP0JQE2_9DINO